MKKLLFALLLSVTSFAQNSNQFKSFLPEQFKNEPYSEALLEGLDGLIAIDPELIFYFLESVNLRNNNRDSERNKTANQLILNATNYYQNQRNEWLKRIKSFIMNADYPEHFKDFCIKRINIDEEYKLTLDGELNCSNKNLSDFYQYIYFSGNPDSVYLNFIDYSILKEQYLKRHKLGVLDLANENKTLDDFDYILNKWYLFKDSTDFILISNVLRSISEEYRIPNKFNFSTHFGYSTDQIAFSFSEQIQLLNPPQLIEHDFKTPLRGFLFSLSLRYNLRNYIGSLAYTDIQLSSTFYPGQKREYEAGYVYHAESLVFNQNEMVFNGLKAFSLKISLPILYLNKNFDITFGIQGTYYLWSYSYNLDYVHTKWFWYWGHRSMVQYSSGPKSSSKSLNLFKYYPTIGGNYYHSSAEEGI